MQELTISLPKTLVCEGLAVIFICRAEQDVTNRKVSIFQMRCHIVLSVIYDGGKPADWFIFTSDSANIQFYFTLSDKVVFARDLASIEFYFTLTCLFSPVTCPILSSVSPHVIGLFSPMI